MRIPGIVLNKYSMHILSFSSKLFSRLAWMLKTDYFMTKQKYTAESAQKKLESRVSLQRSWGIWWLMEKKIILNQRQDFW